MQASTARVRSASHSTEASQHTLYDAMMFNNWLNVYYNKEPDLAAKYEGRSRPEFQAAFNAWLATDPFNNPEAPPGPLFMPEYHLESRQTADQFEAEAAQHYSAGQVANEVGDRYVLVTVFLVSVLFLVAIAERFEWPRIRATVLVLASIMLFYGLYQFAVLPVN